MNMYMFQNLFYSALAGLNNNEIQHWYGDTLHSGIYKNTLKGTLWDHSTFYLNDQ